MRLLKLSWSPSGISICLTDYTSIIPPYAILSHRWREEEILFSDCHGVSDISCQESIRRKKGYQKLLGASRKALELCCGHLWVDTCCIDKSSSAELSEAINSMYAWYEESEVCIAYLDDAIAGEDVAMAGSAFRRSVWFTRGWTLQELVAPGEVLFFDRDWAQLGSKAELGSLISEITGIRAQVLESGLDSQRTSVAEIMSWARGRQTTRKEDRAYSLMGLFKVNMPLLYGEGSRAFIRLQHDIMRNTNDQSIFLWEGPTISGGILADSPDRFSGPIYHPVNPAEYASLVRMPGLKPDFAVTNFGIHIQLPMVDLGQGYFDAYLMCRLAPGQTAKQLSQTGSLPSFPFVRLYRPVESSTGQFLRINVGDRALVDLRNDRFPATLTLANPIYIRSHGDVWPLAFASSVRQAIHGFWGDGLDSDGSLRVRLFVLASTREDFILHDAYPRHLFRGDHVLALRASSAPAVASGLLEQMNDYGRHTTGWGDDSGLAVLRLHNMSTGDKIYLVLAVDSERVLVMLTQPHDGTATCQELFRTLTGGDYGAFSGAADFKGDFAAFDTHPSSLPWDIRLSLFAITVEAQRPLFGRPTLRVTVGRRRFR